MQQEVSTVINSCQDAVTSIATSFNSQTSLFYLSGFIIFSIFLKLFFTLLKTKNQTKKLKNNALQVTPTFLLKMCKQHNLPSEKIIYVKSEKILALTIGLFSPKILFSNKLLVHLSQKEFEAVFLHELHHYKKRHGLVLVWGEIISSSLFFLPVFKDILNYIKIIFEIQADKSVLQNQNTPKYIKQAMLKIIQPSFISIYPAFVSTPLKNVERRILSLTEKSHHLPKFKLNTSRAYASLVVIAITMFLPNFSKQVVQAQIRNGYQEVPQCELVQCVSTCISQEIASRSRTPSIQSTQNQLQTTYR